MDHEHQMAVKTGRRHRCHARGCGLEIPPAKAFCRDHWRAVPEFIRFGIRIHYRRGQEARRVRPSRKWIEAMRAAINYLAWDEDRKQKRG